LKRRVTPPTADIVQKRLDKINGVATADTTAPKAASAKAAPAKTAAKAPAVSMSDDEDLNESFPAYNGETA
jgi:hypothetical protein